MADKAPKNGNIMSFFKPVSQPSQSQATPNSSHDPPSSLPPPSSPLSHKSTPVKSSGIRLDSEIAASDEDDSDGSSSDASLVDLSTLLGRGRPSNVPENASKPANPYATPRSKRTAVEFHSSPLAIMSKHKFDMKALTKDARLDDAINVSSLKMSKAEEEENEGRSTSTPAGEAESDAFDSAFVETVRGGGGHDAQKVLRAVQRAEPGKSQLRYCFFATEYTAQPIKPLSNTADLGPWRFFADGDAQAREQHLVSGLPQTLLVKGVSMPDALFQWMLDDICVQPSAFIRQEYCSLIGQSDEHVQRLITAERLKEMFEKLGAAEGAVDKTAEVSLTRLAEDPYKNRDWSCLRTFLTLLSSIASKLTEEPATYAVQILLRMSLDRVLMYNIDLLSEFEYAIQTLVEPIPSSSWDSFCFETGSMLCNQIKSQGIRANALLCLPISDPWIHELRRRLAVACLFDDPALSRQHPDEVITMRGAIDRLDKEDFRIGPNTDFTELKAGITLLDIAIDDGSFAPTGNLEDERKFNSEVDELALKLRGIWRKINDSGMRLARTEAKSVIEWVQQRLSHAVRTKRKPKKNVFDLPGQREDSNLPRQQDFLQKFLRKPKDAA